jgi:hypothetical protein
VCPEIICYGGGRWEASVLQRARTEDGERAPAKDELAAPGQACLRPRYGVALPATRMTDAVTDPSALPVPWTARRMPVDRLAAGTTVSR